MHSQDQETIKVLGSRIKSEREKLGMDQASFAKLAGTSPTTMSSIENGKAATNLDILTGIAAALKIPAWKLLRPDAEPDLPKPAEPTLPDVLDEIANLKVMIAKHLEPGSALAQTPLAPIAARAETHLPPDIAAALARLHGEDFDDLRAFLKGLVPEVFEHRGKQADQPPK